MKFIQILVLAILSTTGFGQTLTNDIESTYNFKPSKLTDKEQEVKMPALDKFWNKIKSDTIKYLPALRMELIAAGHNPYFYYDGAGLLLTLTNNKSDKELAVEAIAKCDLEDISREIYVTTLNKLANQNINVTKAAVKILADEKFSFSIPQHAMIFNQGYCLSYMLLPQQNFEYVDTLMTIFKTVKPNCQKSIIATLWFAYTCKGDIFLKSIVVDNSLDKKVGKYAKEILAYTTFSKEQEQYLKSASNEELVNLRREALKRFSDEAIEELDITTRAQRKNGNCH